MNLRTRRKSVVFFVTFGVCLIAAAVALNVSWIVLHWRTLGWLLLGSILSLAIIAGLVLNTIFLVREIRRNEQHDSFLNAVTHELKTPIASLRLYLETLKSRDLDEVQRREFYDVMLADSDRLLRTVEQVLLAARTGQTGRSLARAVVDVGEVVQESVALARTAHNLSPEALQFHAANGHGAPEVLGDRNELYAAFANLIENAIKYSHDGVQVEVEVATPDAASVTVQVRDRGVGIPQDELKRIFKRFHRAPGRQMTRVKGTGLGLFIVRSVIEKHGGWVRAESAGEQQGSTFTVQLPRVQP